MNIKSKALIILLSFGYFFNAISQDNANCDGQRYLEEVFTEVSVLTGVKFGEGTTIAGNQQELFMDVYEPVDDTAETRPAVVLAFGGSFIGGERQDLDWLCEAYARRGFVAVTIDYRLYDLPLFPLPSEIEITEVVIKSISDMKAAIRLLREDADTENTFKIDPELIFIGGISAGAITAAHTAFLDDTDIVTDEIAALIEANGGLEGNSSNNFQYSSEVQGLINYSGGIANKDWIDADDPIFISFHDDNDPIVPYEDDFAVIFGFDIIFMSGSKSCSDKANDAGLFNELHTIENSESHVSYLFNDTDIKEVLDTTSLFLSHIICGDAISSTTNNSIENLVSFPNPSSEYVHFQSKSNKNFDVRVFDNFGKQINYWQNTIKINISNLAPGMYLLQVSERSTGRLSNVKLIKTD